jgi:hypothetical protein
MPSWGRAVLGGGRLKPRHDSNFKVRIFSFVMWYSAVALGTLEGVNLTESEVVLDQ